MEIIQQITSVPDHFTPGPWLIKRSGCISDRDSGELVASTGYRVHPGSLEDDANAALIAAAPDMLAALRWSERELRRVMQNDAQAAAALACVLKAIESATRIPL